MTTKRKTGIALLVVAILVYLALGMSRIAFDYPLVWVAAVILGIVGLVLVLIGGRKKAPSET